jgi:hypothetical protein
MAPGALWVGRQSRNVASRSGQPTIPAGKAAEFSTWAGPPGRRSCPDAYQHHEHEWRHAHDEHRGLRGQRRSLPTTGANLAGVVLVGPGAGMLLLA